MSGKGWKRKEGDQKSEGGPEIIGTNSLKGFVYEHSSLTRPIQYNLIIVKFVVCGLKS